jgi:replication factor C subunit 1
VVGQPSSKTNYVVLGDNAGESKLAAIKKHNIKTLSEDEFLNLIATRQGPGNGKGLSEQEKKKKDKEEKAIRDSAKEMEAREKAVRAVGSGVIRGCARTLHLCIRGMEITQRQGQGNRPSDTALDRSICPANTQRGLR